MPEVTLQRMVFSLNEAGQCDIHMASVLVTYCHVTILPQTCTLTQHTLIILFFAFVSGCATWHMGS